MFPYSKSLPAGSPWEDFANKLSDPYGLGDVVVVVVVSVFVPPGSLMVVLFSVLLGAAGSFTTVVLFSVFVSPGGFVTVVSFFSQAGRSAARARRQIYFFISLLRRSTRYF
jgi:hypothetical protein